MSRIDQMNREVRWSDSPKVEHKSHRDYQANLAHCEKFCHNVKKNLPNGMSVKISNSEHLEKALLVISWSPGMKAQQGNHSNPIFLHQEKEQMHKEIENVFNRYMKKATDFQKMNPKQPEFVSH